MGMPIQLLLAKRPKRSEPRPLVELLPRIDIADFCRWKVFPNDWHNAHYLEVPFRYPFLKNMAISLENIEFHHVSGYNQIIPLRWIRTGFGGNNRPRPNLICGCGRSVTKLYLRLGSLKCRRCADAIHASQVCSCRATRSHLQATRLQAFIKALPPKVRHSTKASLFARNNALAKQAIAFKSMRLKRKAMHIQSNYQLQATAYWR